MKPLELVWYDIEAFPHLAAKAHAARRKRLTDAELAALYHRENTLAYAVAATDGGSDDHPLALRYQSNAATFYRFATHPHYDEAQP